MRSTAVENRFKTLHFLPALPTHVFLFPLCCSAFKPHRLTVDYSRTSRPDFELVDPL